MPMVKVFNENVHPFRQEYEGKMIEIPAKKHVEMERDDAVKFLGMFSPVILDGTDRPKPESFKKLRIIPLEGASAGKAEEPAKADHPCHLCGYKGLSAWDLEGHVKHEHASVEPVKDEEAERVLKQRKRGPRINEL